MSKKVALISEITGQDGLYLTGYYLKKAMMNMELDVGLIQSLLWEHSIPLDKGVKSVCNSYTS